MAVKRVISKRKDELMEQRVNNWEDDRKKLFFLLHSIFWSKTNHSAAIIYYFFYFGIFNKHVLVRKFMMMCLPAYSFVNINIIMPVCTSIFDTFQPLSCVVLSSIIHKINSTTCGLEPFPTQLFMSHLIYIINIILRIMNLCFSSGEFPAFCMSAIISSVIKKLGLDSEILKL